MPKRYWRPPKGYYDEEVLRAKEEARKKDQIVRLFCAAQRERERR